MADVFLPEEARDKVAELVESLSRLDDARTAKEKERLSLIESLIPAEIREQIDEINAEYGAEETAISASITETEAELRRYGIWLVSSFKSDDGYQIVRSNGRVSYDVNGLDAIIRSPGNEWLAEFRTEGAPSVAIRRPKNK